MSPTLEQRLAAIRENIADACRKTGHDPDVAEIIAVTKTHGPEAVREAWDAGARTKEARS